MQAFVLRVVMVLVTCAAMRAASVEREIVLTPQAGSAAEDLEIRRWQLRASDSGAAGPAADVFERLGWAYVAKARRTLDAGFYTLAQKTAEVMEAEFGVSVASRLLRGHVAHNLHRFKDAEQIARVLVAERGAPADLALLSDALIEQGRLQEGIATLERLEGVKPGPESWSRIGHVRWLKGDLRGAVAATTAALRSIHSRERVTRAWLLVRLSGMELQRGDAALALRLADEAEEAATAYPPGLFARGRALVALGRCDEALGTLRRARELQPLPEHAWWLADVLAKAGRLEEALKWERWLAERGAAEDGRTLAVFLATRDVESERAMRLARTELAHREDVFSHDAMAWALWARGDIAGAADAMRRALAEGTRDARLFLHAGEIALAAGEPERAAEYFEQARAMAGTLTPSERARLARRVSSLNLNKT